MRAIGAYYPDQQSPQHPADVSVVMLTVGRPTIRRALASVFAQEGVERAQLVIGIDRLLHDPTEFRAALEDRPPHVSVVVLGLPYSTSTRHGGVHPEYCGGSLRGALSLLANSRYVAYLDDDNTWSPDHLAGLLEAVKGRTWAWSRRTLIDEETGADLGLDEWDSVGPDRGVINPGGYVDASGRKVLPGGHVDPNCLLIDKVAVAQHLGNWAQTIDGRDGYTADRRFYLSIANLPHAAVERSTVQYRIRPDNTLHHRIRAERSSRA